MKRSIFFVLLLTSCHDYDDIGPKSYWGCWTEATGKEGYYDVILTENPGGLHAFAVGYACGVNGVEASINAGFFRNDTLIFDNGTHRYWFHLEGDTLLFSANIKGYDLDIEKLIKPP